MVTDSISQTDDTTAFLRAARSGNLEKVIEYLDTDLNIDTANSNGLNALHLASKDGHVEIVTELLKRSANVDASTKKGNTALHIASLAGQGEIVNILIEYGAAVNIQSQNGFTPLYMAAQENHDQVVKLLLSSGANQGLATEDGFTPLAVAMQQGHEKVVSVLLENDSKGKVRLPALHIAAKKDDCKAADLLLQNDHKPDVTSKSGFTPLHIAAHYGNEEIARLLIKRGADVNYLAKHNISPLHVAAKWGKNNMVKILLENSGIIDAKTRDGLTPLHCAARSGHEEAVSTLLEHDAPISARTKNGLAPLHMASQGDHVDAARVLLYHRAPVDEVTIDYLTSLHVAAHCGHVRVAKLLLDRKADPNARALNGFTPLHIACKKNRIKVVELLLKHGASIESTTESGLTPLHVASFMGCMNIVIFLLQHEANPDVPTVRGETPLHLAARANQTDIIRILLRNGAKVDARAREEQTPLHIASRLGNVDIVMLLLQHGASVDTTTKDMYTALHIAAKEGQEEVAAILVENHASVKAATKNGFTPLHIAAKYGNINVAKILLQKDSKLDAQGKNDITPLHLACHYDHSNVANMILEKGASPHLASQNGHTPLHIAARKNQMDIASTLLEHGADPNVQSKAGFTALQLSAQKGHYDMTNLLIEHGADPNHKAKNGLTALHLCAQEDFIRVASILVKNGANVESETETGYRPIHVAAHFGNLSMIRFLLKHSAQIDVRTNHNYTPLHQAAQQGHAHIVSALLEGNASHNARTTDGLTALNVAQKLGYISVMEVLKGLSYDTLTPDNRTWEEKYKVIAPESLQENSFMSDSDDEGGSDALINEQPYRYLTADLMKSLRDDSLPIDVTRDDPIHRQVSKEEKQEFVQSNNYCLAENFETHDSASFAKLHFRSFLVSFLVDARGGAMKGCRHSGIRIIVPPRRATMPIRVTCRLIKPTKVANPPCLMEGEGLATRIIEMGPVGATFLGPVLIDVPHFASVEGKEREIIILRSENGETWKEHDNCPDNDDTLFNTPHDTQMSTSHSGRITRILTTEFPQYFAIVTRIKQEVHVIGADGGILISSVANHVQAVFPPGALTKKIKVGLQAHVIPAELTAKLLGNCVAVSPVITIEPRRRKFHKPITLTIPVPQAANKGMINNYGGETPTLRLLCSIAGGTSEAQWEDVTGSTPLTFMNDRVSFTTTVSARFWLMDCRNISEVPKMATELYKESLFVPFVTNFVIYTKRLDMLEATLRILCMTDGKDGIHTLERQEELLEIVKSRDVEALDGKDLYIEFSGNLVPVTKSGMQLKFTFKAFRQNRLSFHVKVRDPLLDPVARMMFMRDRKVAKGEPSQQPICILNIVLPDKIFSTDSEKKIKEYEDSNLNRCKEDREKSPYTKDEDEKGDKPKPSSPLESKFITDILQKEQTDAATIHESFAQKAAFPVEFVDASYPSNNVSVQNEVSPMAEKQSYTEKRKFWEDITKARENYQRSESELSRTSQITVNESDSECCIQNIVSEEETTGEHVIPGRSETMEDLNIPDISECSVAEKAHYFEEQIQKELSTTRGTCKLVTQDSIKEKDGTNDATSKIFPDLSSDKPRKIEENDDDSKADKQDWNFAQSMKTEKMLSIIDDKTLKKDSKFFNEKTLVVDKKEAVNEKKLKSKMLSIELNEESETRTTDYQSHCKTVASKDDTNVHDEEISDDKIFVDTNKKFDKTKIRSKIPELKKTVESGSDSHGKICDEISHDEIKVNNVKSDIEVADREKVKPSDNMLIESEKPELTASIPSPPEEMVKKSKKYVEHSPPSMIPRKTKTELSSKEIEPTDRKFTVLDKESTSPSEKVSLKMQEEGRTPIKKESRIPVSAGKPEKEKTISSNEDKPSSSTNGKKSTHDVSEAAGPSMEMEVSSSTDDVTSPKKEFESRIPKRNATIPKPAQDSKRKAEKLTESITEKSCSEDYERQRTSEMKSKIVVMKSSENDAEMAEIKPDFSVVESEIRGTTSTENNEFYMSPNAEKIVELEVTERNDTVELSESALTKLTRQEISTEKQLESTKSELSAVEEIFITSNDGKEDAVEAASEMKKLKNQMEELKEISSVKEFGTEAGSEMCENESINIEKDIEMAATNETRFEKKLITDDEKKCLPSNVKCTADDDKETKVDSQIDVKEDEDDRMVKQLEARNIAETIIESIQTEIAKRSGNLDEIKKIDDSESDSREYSEYVVETDTKASEVLHDRMADDLTKKLEEMMMGGRSKTSTRPTDEKDGLPGEQMSNRGSITMSEDFTKDEESTPGDREQSFPSSFENVKPVDRDTTASPSSISDRMDVDVSMESEKSDKCFNVKPSKSFKPVDCLNGSETDDPLGGHRSCEIVDQQLDYESRQDSIDVPSLEIDEPRSFGHSDLIDDTTSSRERCSKEGVEFSSIHQSPAIESLDKICLDRDITVSPSTISEDTNTDFSLVQDNSEKRTDVKNKKVENIVLTSLEMENVSTPSVISPRLRVKELEIKPVDWMIGDEKIQVSEHLQPSQSFDRELEEYRTTVIRQQSQTPSRDESADFEQESGTRSSDDVSAIDSVRETFFGDDRPGTTKPSKFTVVPVTETDFEKEMVETKLEISCQELVDTLQREYEAKTPTENRKLEGTTEYTFDEVTRQVYDKPVDVPNEVTDFSVNVEPTFDSSVMDKTLCPDDKLTTEGITVNVALEIAEAEFTSIEESSIIVSEDAFLIDEVTPEASNIFSEPNTEISKNEHPKNVPDLMGSQRQSVTSETAECVENTLEENKVLQTKNSSEIIAEKLMEMEIKPETVKVETSRNSKNDKKEKIVMDEVTGRVAEGTKPREPNNDPSLKDSMVTAPEKWRKTSLDETNEATSESLDTNNRDDYEKSDDTSESKLKKEDPASVDLSARYAITVLDQVVKKEIAEVKESLEAAKQDLIEELSENSETVFQIKHSPSEFQFKLEPDTIPNDLPFLYKATSIDEKSPFPSGEGSPIAKPRKHGDGKIEDKTTLKTETKLPSKLEQEITKIGSVEKILESETNERDEKNITSVHRDKTKVDNRSTPVAANRTSSDAAEVENKDEVGQFLVPQPAPRRRPKTSRTTRKVMSESDAGSSSGDSSNYQSCDYDIGSGSRPSSSDIEALHSTVPSGTVSEYESALMSIDKSSVSRATSQDYQTAAGTLSSRESMKSLNSLSSGHLGSIDSTGELSETLVASEADDDDDDGDDDDDDDDGGDADDDADDADDADDDDNDDDQDTKDKRIDQMDSHTIESIEPDVLGKMKRSSEMIFQRVIDETASDEAPMDTETGPEEETRFDECTTEQLPSDTLADDEEEGFRTDSIFMSTDLTSEACDKSLSSMESKTDVPDGGQNEGQVETNFPLLDTHSEAEEEAEQSLESKQTVQSTLDGISIMKKSVGELVQQGSTASSTSGAMSFETVIEKNSKIDRHSPDSDSFELVDKPDIIDDFVVIEEVGKEAEEFDCEGKSITIGALSYTSIKKYDRELENLITDNKDEGDTTTQTIPRNNELFDFESESSPPQASSDERYSQSLSDDDNFEANKKWMDIEQKQQPQQHLQQFDNDPRGAYEMDYDRGRLEDIKEEEITDFEAGSSRFGSLGSHKGSIGSVGSMRGSFGSTTDYDVLIGKKGLSKPMEHDNVSLSSLQEFEHLENAVALENLKKFQCGSQDSVNNGGSLPKRYTTGRSGHGDDVSLSSLKDFEGLEKACREAHLIELRAREEEDLLDHESPENLYKLENLPRMKIGEPVSVSAAESFNPSTSGSDDYEKRIMEIDEIIRIAQANVEKFDRHDDTTEDISQIEITADAEKMVGISSSIAAETARDVNHDTKDGNIMETSTDSLELEDNPDKKYNPMCRSSDSLEMKTTIDFPSLSSDSLNNVRDSREITADATGDLFNTGRRISSDSLEMQMVEQRDIESHDKTFDTQTSRNVEESFDDSVEQTSTDTKIPNKPNTDSPSTSDT